MPLHKYVLVQWLETGKTEFTVLPAINVLCNKNPLCGIKYKVRYNEDIFYAIVLKLGKIILLNAVDVIC